MEHSSYFLITLFCFASRKRRFIERQKRVFVAEKATKILALFFNVAFIVFIFFAFNFYVAEWFFLHLLVISLKLFKLTLKKSVAFLLLMLQKKKNCCRIVSPWALSSVAFWSYRVLLFFILNKRKLY